MVAIVQEEMEKILQSFNEALSYGRLPGRYFSVVSLFSDITTGIYAVKKSPLR
jgi:hypothetical protein